LEYLDFFNRPISVGDTVICRYITSSSAHITTGTVTGFTPQKVKVKTRVNLGNGYFNDTYTKNRDEHKDAQQCIIANDLMENIRNDYPENFL
jgi:hypothetical protein